MNIEHMFNLAMSAIILLGFIFFIIQTIISIFFISYGDCKYILSLDSIFSKKTNLSMIWSRRAVRAYWYGLKYPFFCIFNKTQKLSLKMHLFMFINAYASWFWIIAAIWVFGFKQPKN